MNRRHTSEERHQGLGVLTRGDVVRGRSRRSDWEGRRREGTSETRPFGTTGPRTVAGNTGATGRRGCSR